MGALPHPKDWKHGPILLRGHPNRGGGTIAAEELPINNDEPVEFESDLFKGRLMVCVKGANNCKKNPWGENERFGTKKRCSVVTVQGKFKRRLCWSEVLTGWEWERPLVNLPWGTGALMSIVRKIYPGFDLDLHGEKPYFLNNLCSAADAIHSDQESPAPNIIEVITPEGLDSKWKTKKDRKVQIREHIESRYFEPGVEYTFDINGDKLMFSDFSAIIGVTTIRFARFLNSQPFPILAKTRSGEYLWRLELWHEDLLGDNKDAVVKVIPAKDAKTKKSEAAAAAAAKKKASKSPTAEQTDASPRKLRPPVKRPELLHSNGNNFSNGEHKLHKTHAAHKKSESGLGSPITSHGSDEFFTPRAGDVETMETYLEDLDASPNLSEIDHARLEEVSAHGTEDAFRASFNLALLLIHSGLRNNIKEGVLKMRALEYEICHDESKLTLQLRCLHYQAVGLYQLREVDGVINICDRIMGITNGRSREAATLLKLCEDRKTHAICSMSIAVGKRLRFLRTKKRWLKLTSGGSILEIYGRKLLGERPNAVYDVSECTVTRLKNNTIEISGEAIPTLTITAKSDRDMDVFLEVLRKREQMVEEEMAVDVRRLASFNPSSTQLTPQIVNSPSQQLDMDVSSACSFHTPQCSNYGESDDDEQPDSPPVNL